MKNLIVILLSVIFSGCYYDQSAAWSSSDKLDNNAFIEFYEECSKKYAQAQKGVITGSQFEYCLRTAYNLNHTK